MDPLQPDDPQSRDPRRAALLGLLLILVLVGGGLYLAHVLHGAGQIQDCVMSGRTNCAPIEPTHPRTEAAETPAAPANEPTGTGRESVECMRRCRDEQRARDRPEY
jgi:hypothetical protein